MTSTSAVDDRGARRVYCHLVRKRNTADREIDLRGWKPGDLLEVLDGPTGALAPAEPILLLLLPGADPGPGEVDYLHDADDPIGSAHLWRALGNL